MPQNRVSTYIGVAFYIADGFPAKVAIVLSPHIGFDNTASCGTVIETVNGFVESWKYCNDSPPTPEPYLTLLGIASVAKVYQTPRQIMQSINSLRWSAQDFRGINDNYRHPYSNDYVCRALFHLCNNGTISLPLNVKNDLDSYILEGFFSLEDHGFNSYIVIPFADEEF